MKDTLQSMKKSMTPREILGSIVAVVFVLLVIFTKKNQKEVKLDLSKYDSAINRANRTIDSLESESKVIEKEVASKEISIKTIYVQYEKDTTYVNSMSVDSLQSWLTDRYK
jgi:peptidoglycan hydrolase CwlO-like protein